MFELSGYVVDRQIYEGRKSTVYRGTRSADGQPVVLKVLRDEYPSAHDLASFRSEYALSRDLVEAGVSGIIEPLALQPHENALVMVLEDVRGVTLAEYAAYRSLDPAEFLDVALRTARALAAVHGAGVVHKDIKPQNVIINRETREVRLTDFGVSTRLLGEAGDLVAPERLEGTLAYMAPEQTGRMNRAVDHRSDLYSLGITFFELLTGRRPFGARDPMALVHAHIARTPPSAATLNPSVPPLLAAIAARLLRKNARDRYQTAFGLIRDLERCQAALESDGAVGEFPLGQHDLSDRFQLPQALYGRDAEVAQLMAAFDRAAAGASEVLFVAGYSGVGKSRLVHEVKRSIPRTHGMFVGGKIDQNQRGQPYSAFSQALAEFVRQVLTGDGDAVARWRSAILTAVGDQGALVLGVVPELERVIGPQPELGDLGSVEARNRFQEVFVDFVRALATPDHPLVLFLDDLQWADPASLALLQHLVTDPDLTSLLVIGAYRDNEVPDDHPLAVLVSELEAADAPVTRLGLEGLQSEDLTQLVADALRCAPDHARPLAELVHDKTGGNPFFVGQFLGVLDRGGLLRIEDGTWAWDVGEIGRQDLTDNVVEMMGERIAELPADSARALQLAACIGARFHLRPLAAVLDLSLEESAAALWQALEQGLIVPADETCRLVVPGVPIGDLDPGYRFAHDRIQRAARDGLPADARAQAHLALGRTLLGDDDPSGVGERAFEIADHARAAESLVTDPAERRRFAWTNLLAGTQAKFSAAFLPALGYLQAARSFLGEQLWSDPEGRSFELISELAEAEYLAGHHDVAEALFEQLLQQAGSALERARVHHSKVVLYGNQGRYGDSLDAAVAALAECGHKYPARPGQGNVVAELVRAKWLMRGRRIEDLEDLPEMTEPRHVLAVDTLNAASGPAYFFDANAFAVLGLRLLSLTLEYGNSRVSAYAFGIYGMVAGSVLGD